MSQHKSLKRNKYQEFRTVHTRRERVEKLMRNLKWLKGMSVFGLPKEIIRRLKLKIKDEKEEKKEITPLYTSPTEEKRKKTSRDDKETRRR